MEEQPRRFGLGRILSLTGALWIGLFFLARYGLFGSNPFTTVILGMGAFFPIALMFAGRVIRRRGQRSDRPENEHVPQHQAPPRRQARPPDPVTFTELADAVSFDEVEITPDPPEPTPTPVALPMSVDSDIQARTSAEMIADAKKALSADD